jgi:hypothetical protein
MNVFTTKWEKSCSCLCSSTSLILPEKRESFYIPCVEFFFGALDQGKMLDRSTGLQKLLQGYLPDICSFLLQGSSIRPCSIAMV